MPTASFSRSISVLAFGAAAIVQSVAFAQSAPPINNTDCGTLTSAEIGGSSEITLDGSNVTDWDVIYNGVTTNYPSSTTTATISNIVGDAQDVTIRANGFDGMNPVSDEITCSIPYDLPTCSASQDPDSTVTPVDVGTVITLTLDTTNAVTATVDSVPMTPDADPNTNFAVGWTATSTAVANTVISGTATNPEGENTTCTWAIQVNNQPPPPPSITQPPDGSSILIEGFGNQEFVPEWTASTDPDGDQVTYVWELAADSGFSTVLLAVPTGSDNRVVLTFEAVAQLLSSNGINVGDSITLFHRATASDGFASAEGPAAEVTLTLGNVFDRLPTRPVPTLGPVALSVLALFMLALAYFGLGGNGRRGSAR